VSRFHWFPAALILSANSANSEVESGVRQPDAVHAVLHHGSRHAGFRFRVIGNCTSSHHTRVVRRCGAPLRGPPARAIGSAPAAPPGEGPFLRMVVVGCSMDCFPDAAGWADPNLCLGGCRSSKPSLLEAPPCDHSAHTAHCRSLILSMAQWPLRVIQDGGQGGGIRG
jgi:hypothetical protein